MAFIELTQVSLEYPVYNIQDFSIKHSLVKAATGGFLKRKKASCVTVRALNNISFTLNRGDKLGLIGHNGSGKTTLLRVLASIYKPTIGNVSIQGKVASLFNIMLGAHVDLTGYEYLYLSSILQGRTLKEAKESLEKMAVLTELEDFLHLPMRTYSAGMQMRTGFISSTEGRPDILLIDEMFGVGDKGFASKAEKRLNALIESAGILVLSSHSIDLLKTLCNKIMVLDHGEMKAFGSTDKVLDFYNKNC